MLSEETSPSELACTRAWVPPFLPRTSPVRLSTAMFAVSGVAHRMGAGIGSPFRLSATAVYCTVSPTSTAAARRRR